MWVRIPFMQIIVLSQLVLSYLLTRIHPCIVIRNGKIVWKYWLHCWHIRLDMKYLGWFYREYIKTAKNDGFCEKLLSENDFKAILTAFCCYGYGANATEAVQKIAADQKDYHKCSLCLMICCMTKIYQSITVEKGWLLEHLRQSKKGAEVVQKKEQ